MFGHIGEQDLIITPENVLTFYRNGYQSAATLKLTRTPNSKSNIHYSLKSSNKQAYLVSAAKGTIHQHQNNQYIDILINQNYPLEQCLLDRFKIQIKVDGKAPFSKTLKVIINYKKETNKMKQSNLNRLEVMSGTTGSLSTTNSSVLGQPLSTIKKSAVRTSKVHYLSQAQEYSDAKNKIELEKIIKAIEEKQRRLQFLNQQTLKYQSRKKFGCYLVVFCMISFLLLGLLTRKIANFTDLSELMSDL